MFENVLPPISLTTMTSLGSLQIVFAQIEKLGPSGRFTFTCSSASWPRFQNEMQDHLLPLNAYTPTHSWVYRIGCAIFGHRGAACVGLPGLSFSKYGHAFGLRSSPEDGKERRLTFPSQRLQPCLLSHRLVPFVERRKKQKAVLLVK